MNEAKRWKKTLSERWKTERSKRNNFTKRTHTHTIAKKALFHITACTLWINGWIPANGYEIRNIWDLWPAFCSHVCALCTVCSAVHMPLELYVAFDDCFYILYCFTLTLTLFGEHCSPFSCVHNLYWYFLFGQCTLYGTRRSGRTRTKRAHNLPKKIVQYRKL